MDLKDDITSIKGVGPKKAEAFSRIGVETLEDLIFTFPRVYEDRRNIQPIAKLKADEAAVFCGVVDIIRPGGFKGKGRRVLKMLISDDTGSIEVVFFNAAYLSKAIHTGDKLTFFGKPQINRDRLQVIHPQFEKTEKMQTGIVPIYPLTKGISQGEMRRIQSVLRPLYEKVENVLSEETIKRNNLSDLNTSIENMHFPKEREKFLQSKYRLIFEEFLVLQAGLQLSKADRSNIFPGVRCQTGNIEQEYIAAMPYPLTGAQGRVTGEIIRDLESDKQMNRLLQGDVGSGKTAVAEIAMFKVVKNGFQAVMMAPTEILANQHFIGLKKSFSRFGINVGFLSGRMKAAEKRDALEKLVSGETDILVGTHALIQSQVEFSNLGLVITDEQHRFGVSQRVRLKDKGRSPNVLVMTATPIPRTLAVVLYGDMDVSVIDEMPPGRQAIKTICTRDESGRRACYDFVERQIRQGRQIYVVTPLIDQSEAMDAKSVQEVYNELCGRFENTSLIHGNMKQSEKNKIMEDFSEGKIDVLISTVVIEVGINVPNATVMVIENAERFGLAQMHQLRGRVGRGTHQSFCYLIIENESELAIKRGEIMTNSTDGFYIAEEDLKIRGPGEIFGTRQHGLPDMKLADMARHLDVLALAKDEAKRLIESDPGFFKEENIPLKRKIVKMFGEDFSLNL